MGGFYALPLGLTLAYRLGVRHENGNRIPELQMEQVPLGPVGISAGMQEPARHATGATVSFTTANTDVPRLERLCRAITSLSPKVGNGVAGAADRDVAVDVFRELDEMSNKITLEEFRRR